MPSLQSDNLYELLASRFPENRRAPALIFSDNHQISYGELEEGAARLAGYLISQGVLPGDTVAAQTDKSAEALMLYLATLKAGGVYLPLNTAYTQSEVEYFLADAEPRLFVTSVIELMAAARDVQPLERVIPRSAADLASIIYTSGTTGRSKGAMLSHGALIENALTLHRIWGFTEHDVLLHALPIFHIHGLFVALHCALLSGASMVWLPKFVDSEVIWGLSRATVMMGVPTFYTRLLANPDFNRESVAGMRLFISGSAPLLESTFIEFEKRTGHRILERYGMSEALIIASNPLDGERIAGSVGYPLPGVSLRIVGGEVGGIEIKGESVFSGYWRNAKKTREDIQDGWFITGDVGRQDKDGRVWISGRAKDLIICGGYNVYPKEVELVLDDLLGVAESAVIGVPHPDFGEAVIAVVIGVGDEADMIAAARQHLAPFKTPKHVFFVDHFPRNAMGKVQKKMLREMYVDVFVGAKL